ncbi:MAG TPA: CBS domain-containing protein [Pirellulaceae bacterium]|nr:CBS domain-containing protein [Pirellulaceae bacterium]
MTGTGLETLVTYNPPAVSLETTADRLLEMMERLHVQHLPVVDDGGRLLGIVSEMDVLLAVQRRQSVAAADEPLRAESVVAGVLATIGPEARPRQALKLLLDHGIHCLPVLSSGRLLGIVTTHDFLREFSYGEMPGSRDAVTGHLSPPVEPLEPDATLEAAEQAMQKCGQSHLAVVQGGCPIGLVSPIDIVRARCRQPAGPLRDADVETIRVSSAMRRIPALRPGQRLCEAAALMIEHQLPAAIVTNQANRFLGMLSENHLLGLMLRQLK